MIYFLKTEGLIRRKLQKLKLKTIPNIFKEKIRYCINEIKIGCHKKRCPENKKDILEIEK